MQRCGNATDIGQGYWLGDTWKALACETIQWNQKEPREIGECLRDKHVYFLGDSTSRQWVFVLLHLIQFYYVPADFRMSYTHINRIYNFNLTFQFHPHVIGSSPFVISKEQFEVDVLDDLPSEKCNFVIVISPWAHFTQWWLKAYADRLRLIRASILRLKHRCPNVPIIVKGPHVREHGSSETLLMNSDYIADKIRTLMKEILNIEGVYFIDVWDMNLSYPSANAVHMPNAVITQEVNSFLSYICPA